jgi:hypothetical protein
LLYQYFELALITWSPRQWVAAMRAHGSDIEGWVGWLMRWVGRPRQWVAAMGGAAALCPGVEHLGAAGVRSLHGTVTRASGHSALL